MRTINLQSRTESLISHTCVYSCFSLLQTKPFIELKLFKKLSGHLNVFWWYAKRISFLLVFLPNSRLVVKEIRRPSDGLQLLGIRTFELITETTSNTAPLGRSYRQKEFANMGATLQSALWNFLSFLQFFFPIFVVVYRIMNFGKSYIDQIKSYIDQIKCANHNAEQILAAVTKRAKALTIWDKFYPITKGCL